MIGSVIFAGWITAALIIPVISDNYGRKQILLWTMISNFFVVLGLMYSKSILLTILLMFWIGVFCVGRWTIGYIMLMEFLPVKYQKVAGPFVSSFGASPSLMVGAGLSYFTQSTYSIQYMVLVLNVICVFMILLYVPESPKFLYGD
jgi:MFS family permease